MKENLMKDYLSDICNNLKSKRKQKRKMEINLSLLLTGMTNYHIGPCLQTRDRNFKGEAKKRWN